MEIAAVKIYYYNDGAGTLVVLLWHASKLDSLSLAHPCFKRGPKERTSKGPQHLKRRDRNHIAHIATYEGHIFTPPVRQANMLDCLKMLTLYVSSHLLKIITLNASESVVTRISI